MSYYDPVGTTLAAVGVITATDTDAGTYGQIAYSMDQTGLPSNYFMVTTFQVTVSVKTTYSTSGVNLCKF